MQRGWHTDPSANDRENRQDNQRPEHDPRALMNAMPMAMLGFSRERGGRASMNSSSMFGEAVISAALAKEGEVPEPEHVERGQKRSEQSDGPEDLAAIRRQEGLVKNLVLAEEACEREETGNREDRRGHGPERNRNLLAQPSHYAHVLLAAQ